MSIIDSYPAAGFPALSLTKGREQAERAFEDAAPGSPEPPDEFLIAEIRRGNQEALAVLFRRYARLVWTVAERIVRNKADADDLLQDVFLQIRRRASVFDTSKGSVCSLIVHMTYQQALSRRRYLHSRNCSSNERMEDRTTTMVAPAVRLYDESIEAHFGRERTREALEELSVDQRNTLKLFFGEGYTMNEIAGRLGQPIGQVKHHYYRGLERLRKRLLAP